MPLPLIDIILNAIKSYPAFDESKSPDAWDYREILECGCQVYFMFPPDFNLANNLSTTSPAPIDGARIILHVPCVLHEHSIVTLEVSDEA